MMGLVNVIVISTCSPAVEPSPPGGAVATLRLFTTVLPTPKFEFSTFVENVSVPEFPARVAVPISTSEGELTREGTLPEGGKAESSGNTWYTSISTSLMLSRLVPCGTSPIIVALLMTVVGCRMKSSAVSVSSFPGLALRDSAPSRPSGAPGVKENGWAHKDAVAKTPRTSLAPVRFSVNFISLLVVFNLLVVFICCRIHLLMDRPRLEPEPYLYFARPS